VGEGVFEGGWKDRIVFLKHEAKGGSVPFLTFNLLVNMGGTKFLKFNWGKK